MSNTALKAIRALAFFVLGGMMGFLHSLGWPFWVALACAVVIQITSAEEASQW